MEPCFEATVFVKTFVLLTPGKLLLCHTEFEKIFIVKRKNIESRKQTMKHGNDSYFGRDLVDLPPWSQLTQNRDARAYICMTTTYSIRASYNPVLSTFAQLNFCIT